MSKSRGQLPKRREELVDERERGRERGRERAGGREGGRERERERERGKEGEMEREREGEGERERENGNRIGKGDERGKKELLLQNCVLLSTVMFIHLK